MTIPTTMGRRLTTGGPPPAARVGVVGAGQLARMLHQAAIPLDIEVRVLAADLDAPAVRAGAVPVLGSPDSPEDLRALAEHCDVVTFDHELVGDQALAGVPPTVPIHPAPHVLKLATDRLYARHTLQASQCPVPAFASVNDRADVEQFAARHGWPVVIKTRHGGDDRAGVWVVDSRRQLAAVWENAFLGERGVYVEEHISIDVELAVIVARTQRGHTCAYPVLETTQRGALCREVTAPARVSRRMAEQATRLAISIADGIGATGLLVVELFGHGDALTINELALRPHNSGHLTIDACPTSQFEQHLRAILGWPLGSTRLLQPAAAMVDVIGEPTSQGPAGQVASAIAIPEVAAHLYGKAPRSGRKLGHVTAVGGSRAEALSRARVAAKLLAQ